MGRKEASLSRQPGSENGTRDKFYTPERAKELGLLILKEPPNTVRCKYCGNLLEPRGVRFGDEIVMWLPTVPRCDCEKARAYWKAYDEAEEEAERESAERERRQEMIRRTNYLIGESGIKKRFLNRTFSTFRTDTGGRAACYHTAKEYADNWDMHYEHGDGLYIEGPNGTGKTHLAVAIALELINKGVPVICKTSGELLADVKKTFDRTGASEAEILDVYKKTDLLIIDDIGKEQCSDWSVSVLYSIINDRYEEMRPTIITTNYNTEGLARAMTPRGYDSTKIIAIISRLRETNEVVTMAWEDAREGNERKEKK